MCYNHTIEMRILSAILLTTLVATAAVEECTAYCPGKCCTGKWHKYGRTASGTIPTEGRTIAAPRSVAFGTRVFVEGVGERVVEDRLSRDFDRPGKRRWDLYLPTHQQARNFGVQHLEITIIKPAQP